MTERTRRRVERLEAQREPAQRIVVTYPWDDDPGELPPGVCHYRVVFAPAPDAEETADGRDRR